MQKSNRTFLTLRNIGAFRGPAAPFARVNSHDMYVFNFANGLVINLRATKTRCFATVRVGAGLMDRVLSLFKFQWSSAGGAREREQRRRPCNFLR